MSSIGFNSECPTGSEEREFNFLKSISTSASNHHPENVIQNAFVRLQVREDYEEATTYEKKNPNVTIGKNKDYVKKSDTQFSFKFIKSNPSLFQCHLERIAAYLQFENSWEKNDLGIKFNDSKENCFINKEKHHFRYDSFNPKYFFTCHGHPFICCNNYTFTTDT